MLDEERAPDQGQKMSCLNRHTRPPGTRIQTRPMSLLSAVLFTDQRQTARRASPRVTGRRASFVVSTSSLAGLTALERVLRVIRPERQT